MSGFYRAPVAPGQTWFSPVGGGNVPAAAGTIDTFLAGTTTAAATFSDNTGGTSNGVQIVLNSAGRLPNIDIWLPGGVAYKFVIKDAVGNPIATVDNITGENDPAFAAGGFSEWIAGPAATWINATSFSAAGDQVSLGPLNRDRRIEITSGAGTTRATLTSSIYDVPTNRTTVTFAADSADPAPTNPITNLRYGVLSVPSTSFPTNAIELGAARRRTAGSTNTLLFGPIGSNLVTFLSPPEVVASAGGVGNRIITGTVNAVAGSITFNKTAHGRLTGEVVQLTTSNTLPGGTALATDFIVFKVDADNFGLYAKPANWQFEQPYMDPATTPGGLTWGNPVVFSTAGVGNQTVTPGFEAPAGVTRVWAEVLGGGSGGGGSRGNTGDGGNGSGGGNSTFSSFVGTGAASPGGGGTATTGGSPGGASAGTGGSINLTGESGQPGQLNTAGASRGGTGGASYLGGGGLAGFANVMGTGGGGGGSAAATQGSGAGGAGGGAAKGWLTVAPGIWVAAVIGAGGTAGAAGTGTNSAAGNAGGPGVIQVMW